MRVLALVCLFALLATASALSFESLQQELAPADGVTHTVTTQPDGSIAVTATATTTVIIPASEAGAAAESSAPVDQEVADSSIVVGGASACALQRGVCQADSNRCSGGYKSGLCPGAANIRCCMPASAPTAAPATASSVCAQRRGICQNTSLRCGGSYQSGLCPGAASIRCCLPPASSTSTQGRSGDPCGRPIGPSPATINIPASIVAIGAAHTYPPGNPRGVCPRGKAMSSATVRQLLVAAWTAFGATAAQASANADRNLRQVSRESTYCPNIVQGIISGDPNNNNPAGGLFQFIPSTFSFWRVRGHDNRYNPLSNILAAVNAQVNARCIYPSSHARILNGSAGWSPQNGRNPYA